MKPSILFVSTSSNWPLTDGKRQRTWFLIEALSEKFKVDLLLIGYQSEKLQTEKSSNSINKLFFFDISDSNLPDLGYPNFLISKKQKRKNEFVLTQIQDLFLDLHAKQKYSFVFSRYLWPLLILSLPKEMKVVCDIDDVYFEAQKSRIQNEANLRHKIKLQILFFLGSIKVKKLLDRIDTPIIVKESDRFFYGLNKAVCLPNIPFGFYIDNKFLKENKSNAISIDKKQFGFIGKLSYRPNYLGLIEFINLVWNPLFENQTDIRLVIAGSGKIPEILKKTIEKSKNIDLLGFVESLDIFWNQISTLIVPVAEGAGSNIKIAESLIHGKSVIAHPYAARGYEDFINSDYLILPKNNQDWIESMATIKVNSLDQSKVLIAKTEKIFDLNNWNHTILNALS